MRKSFEGAPYMWTNNFFSFLFFRISVKGSFSLCRIWHLTRFLGHHFSLPTILFILTIDFFFFLLPVQLSEKNAFYLKYSFFFNC